MDQPWIEKYRPQRFEDIVLSESNRHMIREMIRNDCYPNLLFYGPPGTGKTTTILCLIREYQNKHKCNRNYIHLNASHERGVDVIRNHIMQFTKNKTFFENHRKFVLLDEMDSLTKQAQKNLYHVIQHTKSKDVTFILICNYLNKVIPCIRNSLLMVHFNKTSLWCDHFIQKCLNQEKIQINQETIDVIKGQYLHDLRSILNALQTSQPKKKRLDHGCFLRLLNDARPTKLFDSLLQDYDEYTILCNFFLYLYEHYDVSHEIVHLMHYTLKQHEPYAFFLHHCLPLLQSEFK
jgi:replication factor C subunit 3/5